MSFHNPKYSNNRRQNSIPSIQPSFFFGDPSKDMDTHLTPLTKEKALEIAKEVGKRHAQENGEECISNGGERGSRNEESEKLDKDVQSLVEVMKRYPKEKQIQRVSSHALSNMAIHQQKCPVITRHVLFSLSL